MKKVGRLEVLSSYRLGVLMVNMEDNRTLTAGELLAAGWTETEQTFERGYVSRRNFNPLTRVVCVAGRGKRNGQLFFLKPSWATNRFCVRQYLAPPDGVKLLYAQDC